MLQGHSSYVTHVDWSVDGSVLQSTDGANELLYWDACGRRMPSATDFRGTAALRLVIHLDGKHTRRARMRYKGTGWSYRIFANRPSVDRHDVGIVDMPLWLAGRRDLAAELGRH